MTKNPLTFEVDGLQYNISFERRRYGTTTYTWVYATPQNGTPSFDLGDPWPCITPKRAEIEASIRNEENRRKSSSDLVRA